MCQFRFDTGIFKSKDHSNVAARLPADVTRCVARLSTPDEMSALNQSIHLHNDSYVG
jgi:hypothetical protein